MSNIDETKVKRLLHQIVDDLLTCFEPNAYNQDVKNTLHKRIDLANLLTNQAPCATVKKEIEQKLGH